jgi:fibronectin-binding autotransporter adhesin
MAASILAGSTRSLYVANGGEVHLTGTTNLSSTSGTVEVTAKYVTSLQNQAALDDVGLASNRLYVGTTLTADVLANGGTSSSVGAAAATADRILLRGSTLKYAGVANAATNRLFTIGTGGATIDASGTGTVDFSGTGALGLELAESRLATYDGISEGSNNVLTGLPSTTNLVLGMEVSGIVGGDSIQGDPTIPAGARIIDILSSTSIRLSAAIPESTPNPNETYTQDGTISFGNYTRTLGLTGSNANNNFMRPLITDSAQGPVGVTKSGTGKWILTNTNTYSGPTAVQDGTLLIDGVQSGGSAYTVAAAGTLGGTGTLGGVGASLTNDGTVAPGASVGTLTVGGDYTQSSTGKLAIEINGNASFDLLSVTGNATLSGAIDITILANPTPNQTFDIVNAASVVNNGLTVTGDGTWGLNVIGGNILRLTFLSNPIQAVPEPGTLVLLVTGLLATGRGRRRRG